VKGNWKCANYVKLSSLQDAMGKIKTCNPNEKRSESRCSQYPKQLHFKREKHFDKLLLKYSKQ